MHKFLATLWVIILIGAVYISSNLFDLKSGQEQSPYKNDQAITRNQSNTKEEIPKGNQQETNSQKDEEISDKDYLTFLENGDHFFQKKDYENAVKSFQKAAQINPNSSQTLLKLGLSYLGDNQVENAKNSIQNAHNLNPNNTETKLALVKANIANRALTDAEKIINSISEITPEVQYQKAVIDILKNQNEKAKETFIKLSETEELSQELKTKTENLLKAYETFSIYKESDPIFLDALLAKALGDNDEHHAAIIVGLDIVNRKNNYRDAWVILGHNYLSIEKPLDAIDSLSKAEDLSPEKPETLFYLGLAYFMNNNIDQAIAYLEKSYKNGYEPKDEINLKLGDLYLLKKQHDKAAFRYERVLAQNTSNIDVFVKAIWLNIDETGNTKKALSLAKKATEVFPNDAMAYNLLGWSELANNNYKEAEKNLTIALNLNPKLDATNLNFGLLYEKQGKTILAKEFYKKAYLLGRGNSIARRAAINYNSLTSEDFNQYYQVDIAAP